MVLFKRKPVQYLPHPEIENDETEVWQIKATGEVFADYESYLARMDFYKQRKFICQITGHSGLSFFDALKSELTGAQEVEQAFPEALKGPVLRRVQFQTISRIDTLVDLLYEEFRADYYPGEAVTVHVVTGERLTGIVRDKSSFGPKILPDGTINPPFSRYFVSLDNRPEEEAVVDDAHITRDRKIFTKQVLRSFIKKTVTRESWTGAPWQVKHDVARIYHIDIRVPPHLRYENKAAERKNKNAQQKIAPDYDTMVGSFQGNAAAPSRGLPELKPAPKSHKSKLQLGQHVAKSKQQLCLNPAPPNSNPPPQFIHQSPYISQPFQSTSSIPQVAPHFMKFQNSTLAFAPAASIPEPPPLPPAPLLKYPIEDLQLAPRSDSLKRPPLKFLSQDTPSSVGRTGGEGNGILMKSVGLLLESWVTLNVYCEIFVLDSFTFDDFVDAMQFSSEDDECELFVEIHCATLKMLVNSEGDDGKVMVPLPEMEEDEDGESSNISAAPTPTPEPEPKPKGRATRSSIAKAEAEALRAEATAMESTAEPKVFHRAAEMQDEFNWIDRLRKRDFKNGGWQITVIGLLYQLSKNPRHFHACETLLKELAPLNMDPTPETARIQYAKLDINLRIQALEILCLLVTDTKAVRIYMEECSEQMTGFRKEKIIWQRDRKRYLEEMRLLNEQRKIQLPANMPPCPINANKVLNTEIKVTDVEEEAVHDSIEDRNIYTDEDPHHCRSLRRGQDRALQRKRKREAEQEKKAEAEAKPPKQTKEFTRLMKDIRRKQTQIDQCEKEIAILDNDLREADCPRTRFLGKDRFWNRYYWFERNGMPYAGLPNSSTAHANYANGCIWVQGPDDMEREEFIEMKPEWQNEYINKFLISVPERKKMEEGSTSLFNAHQWGYYDDPEAVDSLISWLDIRGINESKLQKELKLFRDRIVTNMQKRKQYLVSHEDKSVDSGSAKRMVTRRKEQPFDHTTHRCLAWYNKMALQENGHRHSEQPRARKPAKKCAASAPLIDEERLITSDAKGKKEKGSGRQGQKG